MLHHKASSPVPDTNHMPTSHSFRGSKPVSAAPTNSGAANFLRSRGRRLLTPFNDVFELSVVRGNAESPDEHWLSLTRGDAAP